MNRFDPNTWPLVFLIVAALVGILWWALTDPHLTKKRRRDTLGVIGRSLYGPDAWSVPDMTGLHLTFNDLVNLGVGQNGTYDPADGSWKGQRYPQYGDVIVVLDTCSMGVTVKRDIRGRISETEYEPGWRQHAVISWQEGTDQAKKMRHPLSEVLPLNGHKHFWVIAV